MKKAVTVLLLTAVVLLLTFCSKQTNPAGPSNTPAITMTATIAQSLTPSMTRTLTFTPTVTPTPDGFSTASAAGITFRWKVNGANLDCVVSAPTTGWIGLGFNSAAQMNGANIIIGYVSGGTTVVSDQFGGFHVHSPDVIDNTSAVSGTETGGITTLRYTIPLSNDANSQDFLLIPGNSYWIIMTNGLDGEDTISAPGMPANRGTVQVVL